ncbi:GrpB family protein [Frondihabitans sp. VKM Ac-2883]|uniref:GrpB family protein n=1 Tax=Frondihabitans sp. VKM Ac-2883 TaxID=2783823 RepID=UPI00188B4309|nr:GrpB family protein [Frondihabitans sp. VKM Ac-2883]MBF4575380.1 GrpB family protein [Frondihabitans sp. VKM Ac-2883]
MTNPGRPRRPDVTGLELIGGPEPLTVELQSYDDHWADAYSEHRSRILVALAGSDVDVEHIESTSVPGLAAKPLVDIVVAVADITAEEDYLDGLLAAGYELRTREPGHRLVRTPERDVHVHIYERGNTAIDDYLLLRDHLRRDTADRELYGRVKHDLMGRSWSDTNDYADAKGDVIAAIKGRARAARDVGD